MIKRQSDVTGVGQERTCAVGTAGTDKHLDRDDFSVGRHPRAGQYTAFAGRDTGDMRAMPAARVAVAALLARAWTDLAVLPIGA